MAEHTTQDQSRYQVLRRYRVENRVSGFNAGLWLASSPEEAIARMMDDACCTDQPSPDWLATEVELAWDRVGGAGTYGHTDGEILAVIDQAFERWQRDDPAGDWTAYVDDALAAAGIETGMELDGSDPWQVVRLTDGRIVCRSDDGSMTIEEA